MSDEIYVYYLTKINNKVREKEFKDLFSSKTFIFLCYNIPISESSNSKIIMEVLRNCQENKPDCYQIIVKDSSITNSTSCRMRDLVRMSISNIDSFDVVYLCDWLDKCNLYGENVSTIPLVGLHQTHSPNGTQALMFSPEGRERILSLIHTRKSNKYFNVGNDLDKSMHNAVRNGELIAYTFSPNIFCFDQSKSTTRDDALKSVACEMDDGNSDNNGEGEGSLPLIWFLLIISGLILFIWAAKNVGPNDEGLGPRQEQ